MPDIRILIAVCRKEAPAPRLLQEVDIKWSKYKMMGRDGLQSTIYLGHGQGRGMGGSLVQGESGKLCGWKIAGHRGAEDREGGRTRIRVAADAFDLLGYTRLLPPFTCRLRALCLTL